MIYLDNAGTSQPLYIFNDKLYYYLKNSWWNPSSISQYSKDVKLKMENARKAFSDFINAEPEEIYFTSCGSESNNWAIKGFLGANIDCLSLVVSDVEHPSVYEVAKYLDAQNELHVYYCPVHSDGSYNIQDLEVILENIKNKNPEDIPLVSMMHVNNETGVINDIKTIADVVHKYGGVYHADMVQSLTHVPVDIKELGVDMASFSFCKIGMPRGLGALYVKKGIEIDPLIHGGGQENGLRSGTENTFCILMLGDVIDYYTQLNDTNDISCFGIKQMIMSLIHSKVPVEVTQNGNNTVSNILSLRFKDIDGSILRDLLSQKGIIISTGSACKSGSNEPSRILKAMGLTDKEAKETIRISFDSRLTILEIELFVDKLCETIRGIQMLNE